MSINAASASMEQYQAQWERVRDHLRSEFGDAAFHSWLKPLNLASVENGRVTIAVPTRFLRDWVMSHYADRIRVLWSGENPDIRRVEIAVEPRAQRAPGGDAAAAPGRGQPAAPARRCARRAGGERGEGQRGGAYRRLERRT